ncbi:DUF2835 domain-containing protein [Alteromonas sp.]|nr:DUF2835 domain-containing protein [Alteromonas sp.]
MTLVHNPDIIYFFSINVPYTECEALYSGAIPNVVMLAENGIRVQVPANRLRQFVNREGVKGRFRMVVDAKHKIKSFERIS